MTDANPKDVFGGKRMGGLARIAHEYFSEEALQGGDVPERPTEDRYVSSHGTHCSECGAEIKVICFTTTGVCSELCRKVHAKEMSREEYDRVKAGGILVI